MVKPEFSSLLCVEQFYHNVLLVGLFPLVCFTTVVRVVCYVFVFPFYIVMVKVVTLI